MRTLTVPLSSVESKVNSNILLSWIDWGIILSFSLIPLFVNLPYRVNIFLSYEGAYRLYLGQMPFQDFGMPLGYGYFLLPALFFKLLGPYLSSLVAAQAFLNIITLISFRSILKLLGVRNLYATLSTLVFCLTFTFAINFWPWYNNSAYVYGMFALNLLLLAIFQWPKKSTYLIIGAGLLTALSLFTKQDFGGLWFVACTILLGIDSLFTQKFKNLFIYWAAFSVVLGGMILPLIQYDFLYWFNYGQAPHDSRLHISNFVSMALTGSAWEKIYLLLISLALFMQANKLKTFQYDKQKLFLYLICIGMVLMALITKVTSRLPVDTSTYFHGFGFALVLQAIAGNSIKKNTITIFGLVLMVMLWWSEVYWRYAEQIFQLKSAEKEVSLANSKQGEPIKWELSDYKAFSSVYLPSETIKGIERIKSLPVVKNTKDLKVLNMSELTPLAHEIGYTPLTNQPLWYHLNIGMFDEQVVDFQHKVEAGLYDLVLFEDIPSLTEFYPYAIRETLQTHYQQVDAFLAPRKLGDSSIEVYVRKP